MHVYAARIRLIYVIYTFYIYNYIYIHIHIYSFYFFPSLAPTPSPPANIWKTLQYITHREKKAKREGTMVAIIAALADAKVGRWSQFRRQKKPSHLYYSCSMIFKSSSPLGDTFFKFKIGPLYLAPCPSLFMFDILSFYTPTRFK